MPALPDESLLTLYGAGHEYRRDTSYFFNAATRPDQPHLVIQLTIAGQGFYEDERGREVLSPGRAFVGVIPGAFRYGFLPGSREVYEHVFVGIPEPAATRWRDRLVSDFGPVLTFERGSAVEAQLLEIVHLARAHNLPDRYLLSGKLYQLMMTIYSQQQEARVTRSPRIARAMQLIRDQGSDHRFNIELLARQLDVSREHLTREFTRIVGTSPSDYLARHRLKLAAKLLRSSDDKLDRIAKWSGFSGANYFVRLFRQTTGVTPAEFRRRTWMTL
jgi:AraC-like DNA-binding protein